MSSFERPIGSTDREVETELFKRLPDDAEARERLVGMFLPLAEYLARRFDRRGEVRVPFMSAMTALAFSALSFSAPPTRCAGLM